MTLVPCSFIDVTEKEQKTSKFKLRLIGHYQKPNLNWFRLLRVVGKNFFCARNNVQPRSNIREINHCENACHFYLLSSLDW